MKMLLNAFLFGVVFLISSSITRYFVGDSISNAAEYWASQMPVPIAILAIIAITTLQGFFMLWVFKTFFSGGQSQ